MTKSYLQKLQTISQTEPSRTAIAKRAKLILTYLAVEKNRKNKQDNVIVDYSKPLPKFEKIKKEKWSVGLWNLSRQLLKELIV